jgi:hypothetical protein
VGPEKTKETFKTILCRLSHRHDTGLNISHWPK